MYLINSFIMRNILLIALLCIDFFFVSCSSEEKKSITVTNPSDLERKDELIVVTRAQLEEKIGSIDTGKFAILELNSTPVVIQYDDMDMDSNWDELCFLYSFKPKEKIECAFVVADSPATIKAVV